MDPALGVLGLVGLGFSIRWNWWRPLAKGLPILMYHKIGLPPAGSRLPKLWVSQADFAWQMDYLVGRGYAPITFSDLEAARQGRRPLPRKPVMITFDDGYQNNYTLAYPVLKDRGLKANLFLVFGSLGRHNDWHDPVDETWIPMLTWQQLREMRENGVFEYANHTNILSSAQRRASRSAPAGVSSRATPTRMSIPRPIDAIVSPSTETDALLAR